MTAAKREDVLTTAIPSKTFEGAFGNLRHQALSDCDLSEATASTATAKTPTAALIDGKKKMSSLLDDPGHWRGCAQEARAVAGHMSDPKTKETLLDIAACYDDLAKQAEERLAARNAPAPKPSFRPTL
jgi:hypothetical protein